MSNMKKGSVAEIKEPYWTRFRKDMRRNWGLYLLVLPIMMYFFIFCYGPMYGAIIAFKDFTPIKGILGSDWVGFKHFADFFSSSDFGKLLYNTLKISITNIVFGFPAPIILALLLNEVKNPVFKKSVQTLSYLPHFISLVVVCGIVKSFVAQDGIITVLLSSLGLVERADLLGFKEYFVTIYTTSGIWKEIGWGSIIYLAALSGVSQELYEAAAVDGASRLRQLFVVTLPGILPTIVVMFILRIGNIMSVGFEKIILLYNPLTYETADVISTYVYRRGLMEFNYSYSTAVGLFNAVINFLLVTTANKVSKKVNNMSIW